MSPAAPASSILEYSTVAACALAREENRDLERNARLLEQGSTTTWSQFRGRLESRHLLALLAENAAVKQPIPFDSARVLGTASAFERLSPEEAEQVVTEAKGQNIALSSADYVIAQAKRLGLPTRFARAELHAVKSNQRVLELPGTGGQLAHYLTLKHDLPFREVFTIACSDWRGLTLAGIVALECRVVGEPRLIIDPELAVLQHQPFDMVIGLSPEKGGTFQRRQLEGWFPGTPLVLL